MFDLRRPCKDCPFRVDRAATFRLRLERLEDIFAAPAFQCHKTLDERKKGQGRAGDRPQQCAGLMAVLHREDRPNQIMQLAERIIGFDLDTLDPDGVACTSIAQVMELHGHGDARISSWPLPTKDRQTENEPRDE